MIPDNVCKLLNINDKNNFMNLVTGSTGLVGSHLIADLLLSGEKVRAMKRKTSNTRQLLKTFSYYTSTPQEWFNRIEWAEADVLDENSLREAIEGINRVYHTAAMVSFHPYDSKKMLRTNIEGTANIVNLCLESRVEKLCHVSSISALGTVPEKQIITEDCIWKDTKDKSWYAVSKFRSEMEVWRGIAEGLNAVIVNPSMIIGPGNWKQGTQQFFLRVWKGMPLYTPGTNGWVDVRDVVKAMIVLMNSNISGERFTLTSENLSYYEILSLIAAALGKKPPRFRIPALVLELIWREEHLRSLLFRSRPLITRELARAGMKNTLFSNDKARSIPGIQFRPVEESIREIALLFRKDMTDKKSG